MKLLFLGKQKEFQNDKFNSLESLVIDTIYHIGTESDANFIQVRLILESFIEENSSALPSLNFLSFIIARIEQQLNMTKSQNYTIHDAILEWEKAL